MTIRKGVDWGESGPLAAGAAVFDSDSDAAETLQRSMDAGESFPEIGLTAGDLHRTLGSPSHRPQDLRDGSGMRFPIDLGELVFDDATGEQRRLFVAHLVAFSDGRGRWWNGRTVAVMNAAFRGDWNLGPRGHPNDGRLDLLDGALDRGDRRRAANRAPTGSHVPHPALIERRIREIEVQAERPLRVELDGVHVADLDRFTVRCLPDAATIVV